jgi:hypothetical protein
MPRFGSQIDTQKIPVKGLTAEASGSAPGTPGSGQQWTDTAATPVLKYWDGSGWVRCNGADLPDGTITNAKVASGAAIALSKLATDPLARANHTGTQTASTISDLAAVVQAYRLDQFAAPTSPLSLNGQRATNGATPTTGTDLATKAYVDDARAGITGVKDPVRVAAPGNVNLAAPGASIDGIALTSGDRFLAPSQSTGTQNGIYVWNGAAMAATRATDADATGEIGDGTLVAVAEGTKAGSQYIQTATPSGAPGAWTQTWTVYTTSGTSYVGGAGLTLTGATFDVVAADGSITVNADSVTVGLVPVSKGGTNATTAAAARSNLGAVGRYAADLGALTAGVWTNVTHSLNSTDVLEPSVKDVGTGEFVRLDTKVVDANTIAVRADIAYSAGALRVVVVG